MQNFKELELNSLPLPRLLVPKGKAEGDFETFLEQVIQERDALCEIILKTGGVLLRGFPIHSSEQFACVIQALNLGKFTSYIGGDSPRSKVSDYVYTSTEAPPWVTIPLHNELSFADSYPKHIYFYCDTAPQVGIGSTTVGDARQIYRDLDPKVRDKFISKGIRYISRYHAASLFMRMIYKIQPGHKSWQEVFAVDSMHELEKVCVQYNFAYEWLANNWAKIISHRPATIQHPLTDETVWFNQIQLYDYNPRFLGKLGYLVLKLAYSRPNTLVHETCFADGEKMSREDIYHIWDVLQKNTLRFDWQKSDMLILDNVLAMHGRESFKRPRRILTAMTA